MSQMKMQLQSSASTSDEGSVALLRIFFLEKGCIRGIISSVYSHTLFPLTKTMMPMAHMKGGMVKNNCPICDEIRDSVWKKTWATLYSMLWLLCNMASSSLKAAFEIVSESNDPFYCPQCHLDKI